MLDKSFDAAAAEAEIYAEWETSGAFAPKEGKGEPFCVMMPPPNVTGSLHIGHALDQTIQDALTRFHRMRGRPTLWQPGTDHAGIATQMMVERKLAAEGRDRREIGRDAFLAECWAWKEASHGNIISQLKRLGASPDWSRERFTMDDDLSRAVTRAFVQLYKEGLIYKDKRLVNWDVQLQTAVSDLETQPLEVNGHLWHFDYPLEDDPSRCITVATTRPETMLGDTAVAVHPDDERYSELVGRHVILPLVGRRIPIVADDYSDPEKGTGAVKITPAHDFNDFEVGRRHSLDAIAILDALGRINDNAPEAYRGLDRFAARKRVVADMEAAGRLQQVEKPPPHRAAWRPLWHAARALPHRPVVLRCQDPGRASHRGGRDRPHGLRPGPVAEHLFRVDAQHPALVHQPPALVGPSHPGLVRAGWPNLRRGERGRGAGCGTSTTMARTSSSSAIPMSSTPGSRPASGPSRRSAGRTTQPSSSASTRARCWSPASTSSSSGSPG